MAAHNVETWSVRNRGLVSRHINGKRSHDLRNLFTLRHFSIGVEDERWPTEKLRGNSTTWFGPVSPLPSNTTEVHSLHLPLALFTMAAAMKNFRLYNRALSAADSNTACAVRRSLR